MFVDTVAGDDDTLKRSLPQYLPGPNDVVDPFWMPISQAIRKIMENRPCIPTESGAWRCPRDTLIRPSDLPELLLTNKELFQFTKKEFVASSMSTEVAMRMMCQEMNLTHLSTCLAGLHTSAVLPSKPLSWFRSLYELLSRRTSDLKSRSCKPVLEALSGVPLFPVSNTSDSTLLRSNKSCSIFLIQHDSLSNGRYTFGNECMETLHPDVISDEALPFLRLIGIESASFAQILRAIMDYHVSLKEIDVVGPVGTDPSSPPRILRNIWEQIRFLYDHIDLLSSYMRDLELAVCLPCITTDNNYALVRPFRAYTAKAKKILGQINVPYVALPPYLPMISPKDEDNFARLVTALGCHALPRLIRPPGQHESKLSEEARKVFQPALLPVNPAGSHFAVVLKILLYLQDNFEYYWNSIELRKMIQRFAQDQPIVSARSDSTKQLFPFRCCFQDTKELRQVGEDNIPYIPSELHDSSLLNLLCVNVHLNAASLHAIESVLKKTKNQNLVAWKKLYSAFRDNNIKEVRFRQVFIPKPLSLPASAPHLDIYEKNNQMLAIARIRTRGEEDLAAWAHVALLEPTYGSELSDYLTSTLFEEAVGPYHMLTPWDCTSALNSILHLDDDNLRTQSQLKELQPVIIRAFAQLEKNLESGISLNGALILSHDGRLRSLKKAHTLQGLLIPDDELLFTRFKDSFVNFVHPELMKFPQFIKFLKTKLPSASKAVNRAPQWRPEEERVSKGTFRLRSFCFIPNC